ncbi:MAG TPA: hypothetical protein ENK70_01285, partial [Methylophaga sp.]|nr:hypothetical protein [Methylophaga sp.]
MHSVRQATEQTRRTLITIAFIFMLVHVSPAVAQVSAPPIPQEVNSNSVGVGVSAGTVVERDANFWGFTLDFARRITNRLVAAGSVSWDSETEKFADKPDSTIKTYTAVGTISYMFTERMSLTTGLGKGFADDDNPGQSMQFSNGDLSTGIVFGYATEGFPFFARDSVSLSAAYEYN